MANLTSYEMSVLAKDINSQCPIRAVLQMYGLSTDVNKQGNITCPSINHTDKTPSAKIYDNSNSVYCYSESKIFKPINIVMERENCSFFKACDILIERFNVRTNIEYHNNKTKNDFFPLTDYDYKYLGLTNQCLIKIPKKLIKCIGKDTVDYIEGHLIINGDIKISCEEMCNLYNINPLEADEILSKICTQINDAHNDDSFYQSRYYTIEYDTAYYGIRDLYRSDKTAFNFLIYNKALERKRYFEDCLGDYKLSQKQAYFVKNGLNRCNYFIEKLKNETEKFQANFLTFEEESNMWNDDYEAEEEL